MWKVFKIWLLQIISLGGAGGEGFFAGSRFGGFTKQMLLIWAILAGLLIHTKGCLHLRFSKIRHLLLVGDPLFILGTRFIFCLIKFSLRGLVSPNYVKKLILPFKYKNSIFVPFICCFSPIWTIFGLFWPIIIFF